MADFKTAYAETMKVEGGYANNKADTGGETWKGVARNKNPNWPGWKIVDQLKKQPGFPNNLYKSAELQVHVLDIYKTNYWNPISLDKIQDQRVAKELFDTGVNMGIGMAKIFFQRVLNVVNTSHRKEKFFPDLIVDGIIGTSTVNAFNILPAQQKTMVWKLLNCLQGSRYISICEANPSQEIFMTSWASRVFES